MELLSAHMNAIEQVLLAQSKIAHNAGHPNLRGGPREWFIRDFLEKHLPSTLEIGQGEIIDVNSKPNPSQGEYRPQVDIVIYRKDIPKVTYSRTDSAYLAEGVMAVIESKSELNNSTLEAACISTKKLKQLECPTPLSGLFTTIFHFDNLVSYLVAYDGPEDMGKVISWINEIVDKYDITSIETLDMIVVFGKGVICRRRSFPPDLLPDVPNNRNWIYINQQDNNLFTLFSHMLTWAGSSAVVVDLSKYIMKNNLDKWKST